MDHRKILVYIAGPYRSNTACGVFENIMTAREVAKEVWKTGVTAICPHLNSFLMDGTVPEPEILKGCLEIVKCCKAIVLCPGWEHSRGTKAEMELAETLDIPIFTNSQELEKWLNTTK